MTSATLRGLIAVVASGSQRRHTLRWLRSLRRDYLLTAPSPWLTFDAIEFIDRRVTPRARVFEYGSGGSTLFWAAKGAQCTSVEHDERWYAEVRRRLAGRATVDYRLVVPEPARDVAPDPADPEGYGTADVALRQRSFRKYASQIDEFQDDYFDVVLIDGRSRPSCVRHSASKVRPGGLLIVDNTEAPYYLARAGAHLADYSEIVFAGAIPSLPHWTQTSVFVRHTR